MNFYNTPNYTSAICTQSCNGKTKVQRRTKIGEKESSKNNNFTTFIDTCIYIYLEYISDFPRCSFDYNNFIFMKISFALKY